MSRLYVVEPRLTVTGMSADERLRVQAREVRGVAASVLARAATWPGGGPGEAPTRRGVAPPRGRTSVGEGGRARPRIGAPARASSCSRATDSRRRCTRSRTR